MKKLRYASSEEDSGGIDLTPMLDVVFIMLIFFIVTATFTREYGMGFTRPEDNQQEQPSEVENILIRINANNEILLDGRRIDVRSVRANIERLQAERPEAKLVILGANEAEVETFSAVADAARAAGMYDISLTTEPE